MVETQVSKGASLALYGVVNNRLVKRAATAHIGRSNRWLAPVGAADFDGDGQVDFAYVDRPHLAKVLRIVTRHDDRLVEIASLRGVTNHRLGAAIIEGGIRDCGSGPEIVAADSTWKRILVARMRGGQIESQTIGDYSGPASFDAALACRS